MRWWFLVSTACLIGYGGGSTNALAPTKRVSDKGLFRTSFSFHHHSMDNNTNLAIGGIAFVILVTPFLKSPEEEQEDHDHDHYT